MARVMCLNASGLGMLMLLIPGAGTRFSYFYAAVGFGFALSYLVNMVRKQGRNFTRNCAQKKQYCQTLTCTSLRSLVELRTVSSGWNRTSWWAWFSSPSHSERRSFVAVKPNW